MIDERSSSNPPAPKRSAGRGLDAAIGRISLDPSRSLWLGIVLGVVALGWVAFVGALLLRPSAPQPAVVAALPPLLTTPEPSSEPSPFAAPPPLSYGQVPIGTGEPPETEAVPDLSQQASREPVPSLGPRAREKPSIKGPAAGDSTLVAPLPPMRPAELGPVSRPPVDRLTAIYDISAHSVYLPDGTRLEAHSGLGDRLDDPRFVSERDRGATPPGLYDLTLRESLFHGVQALRLTPLGDGDVFGRSGLLAHPYMLGPSGDSNGCVSFKDYDAFLRAFQNGQVKRLAVVVQRTQDVAMRGTAETLRHGLGK
jgi:Protein of unknown function (DUF2778)